MIDVLDRVLDKGVVIDAHVRISLVGIEVLTMDARVVVASIETYITHAEAVSFTMPAARPLHLASEASHAAPAVPIVEAIVPPTADAAVDTGT